MRDLASRITNRIQLTTDGHRVYAEAVEDAFGAEIDYAMLVKLYGASNDGESRYSPATCIGCRTGVLSGDPDPKYISTSYVERSEEHTSELQSQSNLVCRLLLEKKKNTDSEGIPWTRHVDR